MILGSLAIITVVPPAVSERPAAQDGFQVSTTS
jgi:hypothetical protein